MLVDEGLEILSEEECLLLLASESIGRVGVSIGALPAIFPVNYKLFGGDVVFRTGGGVKLRAALERTVVAFEVDHVDHHTEQGWSVLVVGMAEELPANREDKVVSGRLPTPWVGGEREHVVRIRTDVISGRRIERP